MTTITAQDLAREIFDATGRDREEGIVSGPTLVAIFEAHGIDIETCDSCGEYDGEHVDGCEHGDCGICGNWYRACICDAVYERYADK